ncbi:MAG: flotillin-like FloA family protein [Pirellulales bacterium]
MHPLFAADNNLPAVLTIIGLVAALIVGLILFAVFANYFRLWVQSVTTGAGIGIMDIIGMTFKKVNPNVIVRSKIMAVQAGLGDESGITSRELQSALHGRRTRAGRRPRDDRRAQGEDSGTRF